jgi:succinoglycan biosynthesis protein ExoO
MLASIIIPAFQERERISRAVASALGQSWTNLEVIVIDDCSTDGTAEAAKNSAGSDPRLRVVRLQSNHGPSAARNAGLQISRGDWLAFLDADDSFERDRLATLIPEANSYKADLLADNLHVTWLNGKYPDCLAFPASRMRQRDPVSASGFVASDRPRLRLGAAGYMKPLIRRSFLREHSLQFDECVRLCEDFQFYVSCLLRGAVLRYSQYAGYKYNIRERSLSNTSLKAQSASHRLLQLAIDSNDVRTLAELRRRERDIELWNECLEIEDALRLRRFQSAAEMFFQLPSRRYALGYTLSRFAEKARREAAARFGGLVAGSDRSGGPRVHGCDV